jgi:hypothetical protein
MAKPLSSPGHPSAGDVLVRTDKDTHFVSVVLNPHQLSVSELSDALNIAAKWAKNHGSRVWRQVNDETFLVTHRTLNRRIRVSADDRG